MTMRLIDADALVSALNNGRLEEQTGRAVPFNAGVAFALTMVEFAPTIEPKRGEWIDAVPVVMCKDCKKWSELGNGTGTCKKLDNVMFWYGTDATDYCSFAKRRKR